MSLEFRLEAFEGPLDLLLLLIEKNKVDIYDIPIALITDQYLSAVSEMQQEYDLDVLSDFLVLASTLLDLKARMLLPREEDENGEEIDPRAELVERLIEYQEYKMMAKQLKEYFSESEGAFFKEQTLPKEVRDYVPEFDLEEFLGDLTLERLRDVFTSVIRRQEEKIDPVRSRFGNIEKDPVRISDKLAAVLRYGKEKKHFSFRTLLEKQHTRADVIVTFLACLELIHVGQIYVTQEEQFGEIDLTWNDECEHELTLEEIEQYD